MILRRCRLCSHWFADDIVNHVDDAEVSKDMKRMTRDDVESSESLCDDVSPWYVALHAMLDG